MEAGMDCPSCGIHKPAGARFCANCGSQLVASVALDNLPNLWQRVASFIMDLPLLLPVAVFHVSLVLLLVTSLRDDVISLLAGLLIFWLPFLYIGYSIWFRRGQTPGLWLVRARIVRESGDVSGFFHTYVRMAASILSAVPLGLGFFWAFRDDRKQTWHDKLMHTYVVRNTPGLAEREGTNSTAAVVTFWVLLLASLAFGLWLMSMVLDASSRSY